MGARKDVDFTGEMGFGWGTISILEALSFAIHWPTVGWIGVSIVSAVTVAVVAVEVTGEIQRKRRIRRRMHRWANVDQEGGR